MINYNGYSTAAQPYQGYYVPTVATPTYTASPAQPMYTAPVQPAYMPAQSMQPANEDYIALVSNESEARALTVPNKRRLILLDLGVNRVYIKSLDEYGNPQSFDIYKCIKETASEQSQSNGQPQKQYNSDPITRGELNKILNERFPKNQHNSNNSNNAKESK